MLRKVYITIFIITLTAAMAFASAQQEMEKAAGAGKIAFILLYDQTAMQVEQARQLVADAMKRVPGSVIVEVDRADQTNAKFVAKYRLSGAPVPLILVASSTGIIANAVAAQQATVDQLVKMVPSPKKTEVIKALSEGNAAFITVYRKSMKSAATVNSACALACQQMPGKLVQIRIDMDDPAEANFLTELKVDLTSKEPITLVANAQGQITGSYTGDVQVANLVTTATKKVGGCCPSTVSNPNASCAPAKK